MRTWLEAKETKEMKDFFRERTDKHIQRVKKYAKKIAEAHPELKEVIDQAKDHDKSKFEEPEYTPYLFITWNYKCKDAGEDYKIPDEIDGNAATLHHIKNNRHHPEFHDEESGESSINKADRDGIPEKMTDASKMTDIDIAEMVSDWLAMSEEKNSDTKDWADKTVNKRWKFTNKQKDLIYKLIGEIEVD